MPCWQPRRRSPEPFHEISEHPLAGGCFFLLGSNPEGADIQ